MERDDVFETSPLAWKAKSSPRRNPALFYIGGVQDGIRTHTVGILSPLPPAYCATWTYTVQVRLTSQS